VHLHEHFGASQVLEKLPVEFGMLLVSSVGVEAGLQKDYLGWNGQRHRKTSAKAWTGSAENHLVQMSLLHYSLCAVAAEVDDGNFLGSSRPEQDEEIWEADSSWGLSHSLEAAAVALQQKMMRLTWDLVETLSD